MNKRQILMNEIKKITDPFIDEVLDFVQFLKAKINRERFNFTIASESSLKNDWMKPEEDEA